MKRRIKYVEEFPLKREIIFENHNKFMEFYNHYYEYLAKKHGWLEYRKHWKYKSYKIKKDGQTARSNDGSSLKTPEAIEKQKIAWNEWLIKKRENKKKEKKLKEKMVENINKDISKKYGFCLKPISYGYSLKKVK